MSIFFLAYTATAYLFSGSVCYLASQGNYNPDSEPSQLERLAKIWVTVLWPVWILREVSKEQPPRAIASNEEIERELVGAGGTTNKR